MNNENLSFLLYCLSKKSWIDINIGKYRCWLSLIVRKLKKPPREEAVFIFIDNYFFFVIAILRNVPMIFQIIIPMIKVMATSKTAFQKLKGRRTMLCSKKCIPITRLINLWNTVGIIATASDRSKWIPPTKAHINSANFFELIMEGY